ncbi:hypothetical protein OUZ56_017451 [Daphnia magna]|uniref:Uncharacterized protein n=1 Tax=Daphnia magna TaxID=35525 RepID=A0ABR0ASV9_9CRUS|nr:hypothetical protein OUZ56_017451 [Daphnia magna]
MPLERSKSVGGSKCAVAKDALLSRPSYQLTTTILGHPADPTYQLPAEYTGKLFGVEYLLKESDAAMGPFDLDEFIKKRMDHDDFGRDDSALKDEADFLEDATDEGGDWWAVESCLNEGCDRFDRFAETIVQLKGLSLTAEEAETIIRSGSRVVEAMCIRLFNEITCTSRDLYVSRYCLIIGPYNEARNRIMLKPAIVE